VLFRSRGYWDFLSKRVPIVIGIALTKGCTEGRECEANPVG